MEQPVIVEAARTPIGRRSGWLSSVTAPKLLAEALFGVLDRVGIEPADVDQLIGGCVTQAGQQASNVTRNAWLSRGVDFSAAATTIDCQCGSALQANNLMAGLIATGGARIGIACGVEQMTQVPLGTAALSGGGYYKDETWPYPNEASNQFEAAERIAKLRGLTRRALDQVGVASQTKARQAWDEGRFEREVIPVSAPVLNADGTPSGQTMTVTRDQGLRPTTLDALADLPPVVVGTNHTAGTSSQISDGAAAVVWMDAETARSRGIAPRARIAYHTMVGTDPYYLLDGPVSATQKLLDQSRFSISDFDLFECNEAFASPVLSWQQTHNIPMERVNVNGGAIALGHPVGATGSRLIVTALHELERIDGHLALITMCQGGALGIATVLERLA